MSDPPVIPLDPRPFSGRPFRPLLVAAWLAAALAASTTAWAIDLDLPTRPDYPYQKTDGLLIGPMFFAPSATLAYGYDTNVFSVPNDASLRGPRPGDTVAIAKARLGFKLPFSHSYASLVWTPQYRGYGSADSAESTSHELDLDTRLNFVSGSSFQFTDLFQDGFADLRNEIRTTTPGGRSVIEDYDFASIPYRRNEATVRYRWPFGNAWGFGAEYQRTVFSTGQTEVVDVLTQGSGGSSGRRGFYDFYDFTTDQIGIQGFRALPRYQVYAEIEFGRTFQDRENFNDSREEVNGCSGDNRPEPLCTQLEGHVDNERIDISEARVGIRGDFLSNTNSELEVGYTNWRFESGDTAPFSGISVKAALTRKFNRMSMSQLVLERTPIQASGQVSGYYIWNRLMVSYERKLTMRLTGRVSMDLHYSNFPGSVDKTEAAFTITDYFGSLELSYRPGSLTRPSGLLLNAYFKPENSNSNRPDLDIDGQRAGFSVQYGWF